MTVNSFDFSVDFAWRSVGRVCFGSRLAFPPPNAMCWALYKLVWVMVLVTKHLGRQTAVWRGLAVSECLFLRRVCKEKITLAFAFWGEITRIKGSSPQETLTQWTFTFSMFFLHKWFWFSHACSVCNLFFSFFLRDNKPRRGQSLFRRLLMVFKNNIFKRTNENTYAHINLHVCHLRHFCLGNWGTQCPWKEQGGHARNRFLFVHFRLHRELPAWGNPLSKNQVRDRGACADMKINVNWKTSPLP